MPLPHAKTKFCCYGVLFWRAAIARGVFSLMTGLLISDPVVRKPVHEKAKYPCSVSDGVIGIGDGGVVVNSVWTGIEKTGYIKIVC